MRIICLFIVGCFAIYNNIIQIFFPNGCVSIFQRLFLIYLNHDKSTHFIWRCWKLFFAIVEILQDYNFSYRNPVAAAGITKKTNVEIPLNKNYVLPNNKYGRPRKYIFNSSIISFHIRITSFCLLYPYSQLPWKLQYKSSFFTPLSLTNRNIA